MDAMAERLQKLIASTGLASRRQAETWIRAGAVSVNHRPATLGDRADPSVDVIEVRGCRLPESNRKLYFALHKPVGFVTTLAQGHADRIVRELLPHGVHILPVGRLDRDTSGLLLLSNDGEWSNIVTHPRYGVEKEYRVVVQGMPGPTALAQLQSGVNLPDGSITDPAAVSVITHGREKTVLGITVRQGKKRQLRYMCAAIDHPVVALERIRIGPVHLDGLGLGAVRPLVPEEVEEVRRCGPAGEKLR